MQTELSRPRWSRAATAAALALGVAWLASSAGEVATVTWRGGSSGSPVEPMSSLPAEYPLALELTLPRPMHVYVASHDMVRGSISMFPSTMLRADIGANPLPAGSTRLPGSMQGTALRWHAGDGVGPTSIMIIAGERPLPDLAATLRRCRQMGNAAFPKRPVLGTYAPDGGMKVTPPLRELPHPLLQACYDLEDASHDGPMQPLPGFEGVFGKVLRVQTEPGPPAAGVDESRKALEEWFAPLQDAAAPPYGR